MAEVALVLSCDAWDMADEKTGEMRSGWSIWYVNDYREDSQTSFGYKPTKVSATPEMGKVFASYNLPALCELDYGSRPGAQNKATLTVIGAKQVKSVVLFPSDKPKA